MGHSSRWGVSGPLSDDSGWLTASTNALSLSAQHPSSTNKGRRAVQRAFPDCLRGEGAAGMRRQQDWAGTISKLIILVRVAVHPLEEISPGEPIEW